MTLKEEIQLSAGIINEEVIIEGVTNTSKKIASFASKLEAKLDKVDTYERAKLETLLRDMKEASSQFKAIESRHKSGDKKGAKTEYKSVSKKYKALMKKLKSEDIKRVLKTVGLLAGATVLIGGIAALFNAGDTNFKETDGFKTLLNKGSDKISDSLDGSEGVAERIRHGARNIKDNTISKINKNPTAKSLTDSFADFKDKAAERLGRK
jgi:hypothetical protein